MAREEFIDNLRRASQLLAPPNGGFWLTAKAVEGYESTDFRDWPKEERDMLDREIAAFLAVAAQVPANVPATRTQRKQAQKHLEPVIKIVGKRLLPEWLDAQEMMMAEAAKAARTKGWYVDKDEKEIRERLLGAYKAPRLRIRTPENEVVLDPIACFGSGRRGIVDLVVMPTYETAYHITFKNGAWQIVSRRGKFNSRPFSQSTLVNTITKLPHA